jgi:acyl-[acyl-carrier-protein]-phospholipid O-acyltransferase/long-chain-fatty-acid--[acyl-carrier-protein] ligase
MRSLLRLLLRVLFRFRAFGEEVLRTPGPVVLLPNHVSWLDWLFLLACAPPGWRCVVSKRTAQTSWLHRLIMLNGVTFPVDTDSPYGVKRMAEHLAGGGRLVVFPEGRLSRTGGLMRLFEGTGFLLAKTRAKVILCHLRGAERLPFSPNPNHKRWWRPRVTAHFSELLDVPVLPGERMAERRAAAMTWLRDRMLEQRFDVEMAHGAADVVEAFEEAARVHGGREAVSDLAGSLTRDRMLLGARVLAGALRNELDAGTRRTGVLLPNVNAAPVVLLALWSLGREAALLNFSTGAAQMLACAQAAGLREILTSRAFVTRARVDLEPLRAAGIRILHLEDVKEGIGTAAKLGAKLATLCGGGFGGRVRRAREAEGREAAGRRTAVILFTSGSEGVPKGVRLTHRNLLANVRQMLTVTDLHDRDRLFNAMPLFHSYGLTVGLILPLLSGMSVRLYPSPLHYRIVPAMVYEHDATVLIATNTFLNGYARKAHPYDFRSVRLLFAAAEKLQEETARVWAQRFGVRVLEGYGATECSPCISLNTPLAAQFGSAGRLLPGMEMRLEPVEGVAEGGRLHVRGPNVMAGYLTDADDGGDGDRWYDTGDIVRLDEAGFLAIAGRLKRFAKVGGEMISLTAVEEALAGAFAHHGARCATAVVTVMDGERGEQLCAVTNEPRLTLDEVRAAIRAKGLPNLAVPRSLRVVREIPVLGTGKVNHRELERQLS